MSEWSNVNLASLLSFGNGKSRPLDSGNIPVYGGNGIMSYVSQSNYDQETIIIGRVGAYCGATYYENKPIWISDNALSAKAIGKNNTKYLYYLLKNLDLNQFAEGSSHPLLTQKLLKSVETKAALDPNEQKSIASVLSCLDDKIDLLHRQNKTLESMAKILFRQWFIEETQKDWSSSSFHIWLNDTKGGDWGKEFPTEDFIYPVQCVRGTDISDLQNGLPARTPLRFVKEKKFVNISPENGDIIIEISGGTENQSTGRCYFINDEVKMLFKHPVVFSNFCRLLKIKKKEYSYFVYLYLSHLYENNEMFAFENGSSGIKNLDYKTMLFTETYRMPPCTLVEKFDEVVKVFFCKIISNKSKIQTIKSLRDTLLPKLMSGEVRVQYAEEAIASVA
ncbi:restriction endonuclease subunit S [Pantoea stewartii]|uniref:restriction endonuclease subunit S n=1 Tax=Pantoea stewartii TaxID=66269 RepID=UPI0013DDF86A|nr:restriction endonuclease subunit S [Pantoea stewartii]QIE96349.1 restriction endonuclease subunit S [Pantoea stewartii]